jgi:MFS family permease
MGETPGVRAAAGRLLADRHLRSYYLAYVAVFFVTELYAQVLPLFVRSVGVSLAALGVAKGVANAAEVVASPVTGVLADRYDRRAVGVVVGVALAGAFAVFPLAGDAFAVGALVVVVAVATTAFTNSVTPAIDAALEDGLEGLGWGLRDVGIYLGGAAGVAAGAGIVAATDVVGAAFLLALPVLAAMAWGLNRTRTEALRGALPGLADVREGLSGDPLAPFRAVSNRRVLATFCTVEAFVTFGWGASFYLVPVLAVDRGLSPDLALLAISGSLVAAAPLSLLGGVAADRVSRKRLYVANYGVETLTLLAFGVAGDLPLFALGLAFYVVQTTFEPAVGSYFFAQFPDDEGARAWSVEGTVAKAVGVVAPAVGGVLYELAPRLPFLLGAGSLAVATLVAVTLPAD